MDHFRKERLKRRPLILRLIISDLPDTQKTTSIRYSHENKIS